MDGVLMAKKLLAVILALVITFSIVGIWYYTSYPTISVGKSVGSSSDKFEKEFHSEHLSIVTSVAGFLPDSPLQRRKMDEVWKWNDPIVLELTEYSKEGGLAYNIEVFGEIEGGKTTLRYEGYIIKNDGERIEYFQEKTFDFVLCSEKRFFTGK